MKITDVEAIYVRQPDVKARADSGQDAILIKVHTDEGITGIGEVDSAPLAVKGYIDGPYSHTVCKGLKHILIGEDPFQTEYLVAAHVRREYLRRAPGDSRSRHGGDRSGAVGYQGQNPGVARVAAVGRRFPPEDTLLCELAVWRYAARHPGSGPQNVR